MFVAHYKSKIFLNNRWIGYVIIDGADWILAPPTQTMAQPTRHPIGEHHFFRLERNRNVTSDRAIYSLCKYDL